MKAILEPTADIVEQAKKKYAEVDRSATTGPTGKNLAQRLKALSCGRFGGSHRNSDGTPPRGLIAAVSGAHCERDTTS